MSLHLDAARTLRGWAAPSPGQDLLRAEYLGFLEAHDDAMLRACMPGHITASALVFDAARTSVLLTLHPKVGRWLQLGGHCEPADQSLADAARREATEEGGIDGLVLLEQPARLDRHVVRCRAGGAAVHYDVQYVALSPAGATAKISEESLELAWWPVHALPDGTDDSVRALVHGALSLVG